MKNSVLVSLKLLVIFSVLLGVIYPLSVTVLTQALFAESANGSLIVVDGKIIGSELIAQKTESPQYFWPRPSASDYGAVPSGASNQGPTSKSLKKAIDERREKGLPKDLLFSSGSGLDPHIGIDAALHQVDRIVQVRQLSQDEVQKLKDLVNASVEKRDFRFLGEERINVLKLNLALDQQFKK